LHYALVEYRQRLDEVTDVRVFVPIDDDFVPETALLVPYRPGMACWHALGESAFDVPGESGDQRCTVISSPEVKPSLAA
jgi:hypothetical protein